MQDPNTAPSTDTEDASSVSDTESMMVNLKRDVTAWNKGRAADEGISSVAIGAPPPRKAAARTARPAAPKPAPPVAADGKKPPFRMSYDGVSAAEYAASRHARGAR